ncbi:MAG: hypothetical protein OHK0038_08850 [Flammeovirgaceae bacterium]
MMPSFLKYIVFIIFLISFEIKAQLSASLSVPARVSGRVADWVGDFRTQKFILTVTNPSSLEFRGYLKVKVFNGSGALIAESVDERQEIQVFTTGTTVVDVLEVLVTDVNIGGVKSYDSDLLEKLATGLIPEDNYQVCVNLIDGTTDIPLIGNELCKFVSPIIYQAPLLLQPFNNSEIEAVRSRLILRWNGVSPTPPFPVKYHVQVFEVLQGQTPEIAFRANTPILDEFVQGATQLVWPPSYDMPRVGGVYVWNVQALDFNDVPVGEPNGRGVPSVFRAISYGNVEEKKEETQTLASKPALEAPKQGNVLYTIVVKPEGNNSQTVPDVKVRIEPATDKEIKYKTEKVQVGTQEVKKQVTEEQNGKKVKVEKLVSEPVFQEIQIPYYEEAKSFKEYTTNEEGKIIFEVASGAEMLVTTYVDGKMVGTPEKITAPSAENVSNNSDSKEGEKTQEVVEPKPFTLYVPPKNGELSGTFVDKKINEPLKNATVAIYQKSADGKDKFITTANTNQEGKFTASVPEGEGYYILVNDVLYQEFKSKTLSVRAEQVTNVDSKAVPLKPHSAGVTVKVMNKSDDKPLSNAKVAIFTPSGFEQFMENPSTKPLVSGTTSSNGEIELNDVPINDPQNETSNYVLVAFSETHQMDFQNLSLKKTGENQSVVLKLQEVQKVLSGQVKNDKGEIMANAKVELFTTDGKVFATTFTDGNGKYSLTQLPKENAGNLVFSSTGNVTQIQDVGAILNNSSNNTSNTNNNVASGTNAVVEINANANLNNIANAAKEIKGRVVNQFDEAFAGVKVECEGVTTNTDNSGNFILTNLSTNTQKKIKLSKNGEEEEISVSLQSSPEWKLEEDLLEYKNKLSLQFYTENGEEIKGVKFQLKGLDGSVLSEQYLKNSSTWEGFITVQNVWIGKKIVLSATHEKFSDKDVDIKINDKSWFKSPCEQSIVLNEKSVTIKGILLDETTNKPISNATIEVNGTEINATTNDKGEYELKGLWIEKSYKVIAKHDNYSKNYITVTVPEQTDLKAKNILIDKQDIKVKANFISPKSIFGFECSLTRTEASGDGSYEVDGTLKIPADNAIKTSDGKIEFKKLKLDAQGIPLNNGISLGASLPVTIWGATAEITSPVLRFVNSSGQNISPTEGEGIGVVTGEVKISSLKIKSGFQGEGGAESLPELILSGEGIPLGIVSKGSLGNIEVKGLSEFTLQKNKISNISDIKMTEEGLDFKASLNILGGDFADTQIKMKAVSDGGVIKWDVISLMAPANIEAEKGLFKLEGDVSFSDEQGDGTSSFVYVLHRLSMLNETIQLANENPIIPIDEKGKIQDQQILVKGSNSDKAAIKVVGQALSFSTIRLVSAPDEPSLEMAIDASTIFALLHGDVGFEVTLTQGGELVATLGAPVKVALSGLSDTPIKGVELSISEIETNFGGENKEWVVEGGIEVSFLGQTRVSSNSSGATAQEKPISSEFRVKYGEEGFTLEKAFLEIPIQNGVRVGGAIEFPEEGGLGGSFLLSASRGGANFELKTAFRYIDNEKWNLNIDYTAATAVPLGPYIMGVGLGGTISRYNSIWGIGLRGVFRPNEIVLPLLKPAQVYCTLSSEVKFGTDDLGNPMFTLDAGGTVQAFDMQIGQGRVTIDFNKKTFEGSVIAIIDKRPFVYADATMDIFIGKNPFVKEDFGAMAAQQQAAQGNTNNNMSVNTQKGKFNSKDLANNALLSGDNPKFIIRFGSFAKMEVLNRPVAKGAFLIGNGLKLHKWYRDLEIERETLKSLSQKPASASSQFAKERYQEINEILSSIPSTGVVFNFEASGSAAANLSLGASSIAAGYDFNAKSAFVLDMDFSGKGYLNFNTIAHADFKVLGWSVAGAKGASAIKAEWQANKGNLVYFKGAGNIQVQGYIGNDCDCNSACLVGAKGCTNASLNLNYVNNNLTTNVVWK